MAASEAAAAGPAALASGVPAVPAAARGAAAASGPWGPPGRLRGSRPRPAAAGQPAAGAAAPARELIQPSVSELSRAVRTNILCTVRGCGKILPNSPALNMHLVKSHRLQVSPRGAASRPGRLGAASEDTGRAAGGRRPGTAGPARGQAQSPRARGPRRGCQAGPAEARRRRTRASLVLQRRRRSLGSGRWAQFAPDRAGRQTPALRLQPGLPAAVPPPGLAVQPAG